MNSKIAIATPTNRGIQPETYLSLVKMALAYPRDLFPIVATNGYTISENRHYLVANAIRENCARILMVDDDMIFPSDTLERLLKHNKDIIGVNANSRGFPLKSTVEPLEGKTITTGLFECKAVGGGVLLINLEVFNKIPRPWFAVKTHENGFTLMGEDSWFCEQARKVGYTVWCDGDIKIGHIGLFVY